MKKILLQTIVCVCFAFVIGCNNNPTAETLIDTLASKTEAAGDSIGNKIPGSGNEKDSLKEDKEFILEAASGGMMEVELGQYASKNGFSPKVKEFGMMMVTDHSKANTELKAIAQQKNVTISTAAMKKHQNHINEIKAKKGADFDKAYMTMMVKDHQDDIENFEEQAQDGKDADVRAFATKSLPILKKHLERATAINGSIKNP